MTRLSIDQYQAADQQNHLHPFSNHKELAEQGGRVIAKAEHIYIEEADGTRLMDAFSGLWCCNLGYSQPAIAEAVNEQLQRMPYYNNFFQCANEPAIELAKMLAELAPAHMNNVFFTNSGSEANDTVIKLAHRYWDLQGQSSKRMIIGRENAYHGSTIAGASLGGMDYMHKQFAVWPYTAHIGQPYWYAEGRDLSPEEFGLKAARELEAKIDELGEDKVAAFIGEPIQGAGGVIVPPDSYWPEIQRICRERNILLVTDEVICGFGRTGEWFGAEYFGIEPDLMPFAKAVTNGFQPLGGVMVGDRVADALKSGKGDFNHGYTYSGHPVACAAAIATLQYLPERQPPR